MLLAKCSCLMMMTLKVAFLGHSYDFDMSSSHWGIEPGVNSVIFKVLIDKPIAYYWSIESGSKLKGTVPTSSSGCRISRLVFKLWRLGTSSTSQVDASMWRPNASAKVMCITTCHRSTVILCSMNYESGSSHGARQKLLGKLA